MKKKARNHSVNFNPKAEYLWRKVSKCLPRGWLSEFVSQALIKEFDSADLTKKFANEMIRLLEVKKLELTKEQLEWLRVAGKKDK